MAVSTHLLAGVTVFTGSSSAGQSGVDQVFKIHFHIPPESRLAQKLIKLLAYTLALHLANKRSYQLVTAWSGGTCNCGLAAVQEAAKRSRQIASQPQIPLAKSASYCNMVHVQFKIPDPESAPS